MKEEVENTRNGYDMKIRIERTGMYIHTVLNVQVLAYIPY